MREVLAYGPEALQGFEQQPLLVLDDIDAVADQRDWVLALLRLIDRRRADGYSFLLSASAPPEHLPVALPDLRRSEARRVGKECGRTSRSRWRPSHLQK